MTDQPISAERADTLANEYVAAGALFAALSASPAALGELDVVSESDVAALTVRFPFLKSAYRLTVTIEPDTAREDDVAPSERMLDHG